MNNAAHSYEDDAPEATRCAACEGTGMVQCAACFLADSVCDACGEPAEVLIDGTLPLCRKCAAPVCWYCSATATERRKETVGSASGHEIDVCEACGDDLRRGDELARRAAARGEA